MTGGTFYLSYDGVTYVDKSFSATVSDFRLDRFEITVGRFRKFKEAWDIGWRPAAGTGKHAHLNGGNGLVDSSGTTAYERGWDTTWANSVDPTDVNLSCYAPYQTWTAAAGANETRPINCVNWYEAAAFCVWDGGFLPSEAEWNYAAAAGAEQRVYPWSSPANSTANDCSYANYLGASGGSDYCVLPGTGSTNNVGSESPKGNGKYGQADLGGNVWEWNVDRWLSYVPTCNDCADLNANSSQVVLRGGSFLGTASFLLSSNRNYGAPSNRHGGTGARCARSP